MRIALIAPPYIAVPPKEYGGTELFVAHLAHGLKKAGVDVVLYANGDSTSEVALRWLYPHSEWPIKNRAHAWLRGLNHHSWALAEARLRCDVVHVQSPVALSFSRFIDAPFVLTLHDSHNPKVSAYYAHYPAIYYVAISHAQRAEETMPRLRTIYHGIQTDLYKLVEKKQPYLSFIGRIAPIKGTHLAIDVAHRTGIPLKIAGEVQPDHREYFEQKIKPHLDGSLVEYIGPANLATKNELLGNSMAMLFPVLWNEPFGLVMVEAMACGTPVLATPGGSVAEVVKNAVSGYICRSVREMAKHVRDLRLEPQKIRAYAEENFSTETMVGKYVDLYQEASRQQKAA